MAKKNRIRESQGIHDGSRVGDFFITAAALLVMVITLYPMYYVLVISFSGANHAAAMDVYFWPKDFQLDSYRLIVLDSAMWRSYGYTIFYVLGNTVLMLITCTLGAYPLTVKNLFGRRVLVVFFLLIPMYFNGGLIPTYLLTTSLGLYDNVWVLIIPSSFSLWYIVLMRTYFHALPPSLRESAFIDGASHFQIMTRIYVPISTPIMAVIAIYTIVNVFNSWFAAMVYVPNVKIQPLQMYLRRVLVDQSIDLKTVMTPEMAQQMAQKQMANIQIRYAMIIFTTLPILFTYPFFQKYFVKGVMVGSLKE